ncbi:MAG: carboxymethylenebutenolidase [Alphaproteobacteria bacterium]|jgi:carboxymethylenebutenolidase|nr:carboxymethylenebutenolidase [Alphaproteobacteria bacterium]
MAYEGLQTEVVPFRGHNGDPSEAYYARPSRAGKFGGVVVIHAAPGWDEWTTEVVRKFAHHGYAAVAPHLYVRFGAGSPDDVAARARAAGGASDAEVMGDVVGAMAYLRAQANSNGKIGVIGFCSGGRHTYLAACTIPNIDAAVDCWGGRVVVNDPADISPKRPVAPIDLTASITAPLLGLFGNDDQNPSPADVNKTEETLKKLGKSYEFQRYNGAGHAFLAYDRPSYRQEQALDGWTKVLAFYAKYLGAPSPAGGR